MTYEELLPRMRAAEEAHWTNPQCAPWDTVKDTLPFTPADIDDAEARLNRFAPVIAALFPETRAANGIIESPLTEIPATAKALGVPGRLFLKRDSDLPVSGSVKARGGIHEVLCRAESLALCEGLLTSVGDDYTKLLTPEARAFFATQKLQVGSTGNLGMSIGIMGAALGFTAIIHMSADAKQWKKDLLRARGATVVEYAGDYGAAVKQGRALSDADPNSYFVDDENSRLLFTGYAVAARRLTRQLPKDIKKLRVYLPCGVGGAPGGIAYGLKTCYGDDVEIFFAEPTQAPCMLLGLASGLGSGICASDIGLSGRTQADGLAVGRCSRLVCETMRPLLRGESTVDDARLLPYMKTLYERDGLFIEPSACASFKALTDFARETDAVHIVWATGGGMVPDAVRKEYGIPSA